MGNEDFNQIKKVLASAGGGKTTALSKEFISILKDKADSLNNILAITFTNKAANEMKERILRILKEEALKGDSLSEKLVENIIKNFSDFSVKTIDSFTYSMIRAFQFELGINFETEVKLNKEKYFEIAFERLIEETIENEEIRDLFLKYGKYYSEQGSSLRFWENMYKNLNEMLDKILDRKIKLEKIEKIDDVENELFFSYCFSRLIAEFQKCLNEVEKEKNIVLIKKFGNYIKKLYDDTSGCVPFIYYKIGNRFRHILIDEFQDTSIIEWENIHPIIENILSEGGTFFYVGDPKQSIYQWRGGEPSLFDKATQDFINYHSQIDNRNINYRSRENIVKFVSEIIETTELKYIVESIELPMNYFKDVRQEILPEKKNSGYVVIKGKDKEEIEDSIVMEIKEMIKRWNYSDIAILVRKNDQARAIAKILSANGIPYCTRENLNVLENEIVREIISLLKFIETPADNLSFFNFITGKCFEKISGLNKELIINKLIGFSGYLYIHFKDVFRDKWEEFIEPYFKMYGYIPVYELILDFIRNYKIYENFDEEIAFVEGFIGYIYKLKDSGNNISVLLEDIKYEKIEINQGALQNAVVISTIHSAKGLEFPVVFLPYITYGMRQDAIPTKFFIGEEEKKFVCKKSKNESEFEEKINKQYIENAKNIFIEELNLLYVALTRAKEEIYIYYLKNEKKEEKVKISHVGIGKFWNTIFNIYMEKQGKEDLIIGNPVSTERKKIEYRYFYPERKTVYDEVIKSIIFKRMEAEIESEKIGEAFHNVLLNTPEINREDIFYSIDCVVNRMFPKYKKDYYREKLISLFNKLLEWDEVIGMIKGKNFMVEKWGYDEKGLLRMDNVIIEEDNVKVLDFKTGKEKSEDKKQIKRYKKFLEEIYKNKNVKGFLIYIQKRKLMEV